MGNTGLVGNMCAGAIAHAIDAVLDMPEDDVSVDVEHFDGGDDESPPITPKDLAPRLCSSVDDDFECEEEEEEEVVKSPLSPLSGVRGALGAEIEKATAALSPPPSPSLMSILVDGPQSPLLKGAALDRSRADSPSILVLDDGPRWTSSRRFPKILSPPQSPKPQTPPRSVRRERPVLLGAPEPLSARARCGSNEPPLSVRFKSARGEPRGSLMHISKCGGA
jgi:hypothetical protein